MNDKKQNKWATSNLIVSGIITVLLVCGGLAVLLPMSSDNAEGYSLPGGVWWDMDDVVANSAGAVTGGSGTYNVHEDIFVPHNTTLSLDSGELVYFDENTGFNITGNLYVLGNSTNRITFTSNKSNPTPGVWDGITFYYGNGFISYAGIFHADRGIYLMFTNVSVDNSIFEYNYDAIVVGDSGTSYIESSLISNNTYSGIDVQYNGDPSFNPDILVNDCDFIFNGRGGIKSYGEFREVWVYNSYFYGNNYGISGSGVIQITDSEIDNSNLYDLDISYDTTALALNTTFDKSSVIFAYNCTLEVQWYLHVLVINASGPVYNAKLTVTDNSNGTDIQWFYTDILGREKFIVVTEYIEDRDIRVYYTPHDVLAEKGVEIGYAVPFMDESKFVTIDISNGTPPPNQPPVADAGPDQTINKGDTVFFDGSGSYDTDGVIVNYTWDFDDGAVGFGEFPTHVYTVASVYYVNLTVTDDDGATASDVCIITVEEPLPLSPTDLNAELAPGSLEDVRLTWTASGDDGAGEDDIASYEIYRADFVDGPYIVVDSVLADDSLTYSWTDIGKGDLDWNNYFYIVRAKDGGGLEDDNENKVGKFAWNLEKGWNLFSVPLVQSDTSRDTVLQTIDGNYAALQGYHAGKSRPWLHWHRDKPNYFNDEIEVTHEKGYYIDMIVPDYLVTAGKVASQTDINLKSGWNLVGFPCLSAQNTSDALSSIEGNYNMVEYFDPIKDKEVRLGSNDPMIPGLGYWIHATADCTWVVTN
jgi:hypothetical protein